MFRVYIMLFCGINVFICSFANLIFVQRLIVRVFSVWMFMLYSVSVHFCLHNLWIEELYR